MCCTLWSKDEGGDSDRRLFSLKKMNDVESKQKNGAAALFLSGSNLHFPFNISFNGNKLWDKMEIHWVSDRCSWVLQREGGLTSFSEWMKMTYAVGLHESKLSRQGYPVQQCSVWFGNCSLADPRQDRGWLCPLGLLGRILQWQTSPAARLLPDSAPDNWSNTNEIRCRRRRQPHVYTHAWAMAATEDIILAKHNIQLLLLPLSRLDKDWEKAPSVSCKHTTCGLFQSEGLTLNLDHNTSSLEMTV